MLLNCLSVVTACFDWWLLSNCDMSKVPFVILARP